MAGVWGARRPTAMPARRLQSQPRQRLVETGPSTGALLEDTDFIALEDTDAVLLEDA
jgi:hypothetical protein